MCIRRVQIVRRYNFTSLGIKMYTLEDQGLGLYNATSLENSSVFYYLNVVLFFSLLSIPLLDKINVSILILTGCFKQLQRLTITPILQGSVIFITSFDRVPKRLSISTLTRGYLVYFFFSPFTSPLRYISSLSSLLHITTQSLCRLSFFLFSLLTYSFSCFQNCQGDVDAMRSISHMSKGGWMRR